METFETPQPTQTIEPKPTNWPKIILTAVLGLGLLAGAAYAGYWYGTESAKLKSPLPPISEATPTPTPSIEDETKNWKTYTNTKYGYKVSYPDRLTAKEQTSDIFLHQVSFESSTPSYLVGFIVEVREGSNIANEVEYRKWRIVGHVADRVKNESAIDVAGYQGARLDYEVTGSVPEDKKEFGTVILTNGGYTYTIEANVVLLPQILSTFKFLD